MWHVMQVKSGKEEDILRLIERALAGEFIVQCFLPYYERKRKYRGIWRVEQAVLFPGYVFVETDNIKELYFALKEIPELTKVLRAEDAWLPLYAEEEDFLKRLMGEERVVRLSKGYIEGEKVIIKEGPMQGLEGMLRKIDRHKRIAIIEAELFMRKVEVSIGLEIVEKR